ncbi:hypothetical protein KSS87_010522 [Heliosperma pusillum]|nr:hypothetical protein KSS87_010522 [Heliosperma pusillum]
MKSLLSLPQFLPFPFYKRNPNSHLSIPIPNSSNPNKTHLNITHKPTTEEDGIPIDEVKTLVKFKSRYNFIRVLEVSRTADHPFRGSRLLLLDGPGNIHSINFLHKTLTDTYFDVFATFPPILPSGPIGILGFGAGSTAKLILQLYPHVVVHGWELDPAVVDVGREFFGLSRLERDFKDRLFVYIGDALNANVKDGFAGVYVDLFSKGSLVPQLQDTYSWEMLKGKLRKGGRIMVNVGGSCVEAEDSRRDGKVVMEESLKAMYKVFGDNKLHVLSLGNRKDDSSLALTDTRYYSLASITLIEEDHLFEGNATLFSQFAHVLQDLLGIVRIQNEEVRGGRDREVVEVKQPNHGILLHQYQILHDVTSTQHQNVVRDVSKKLISEGGPIMRKALATLMLNLLLSIPLLIEVAKFATQVGWSFLALVLLMVSMTPPFTLASPEGEKQGKQSIMPSSTNRFLRQHAHWLPPSPYRNTGDWKLVALPRVLNGDNTAAHGQQMGASNRRSLRHGPSFVKNPSPHSAQENHGGEIGGGV